MADRDRFASQRALMESPLSIAALLLCASSFVSAASASAIDVRTDTLFYGDNTEFSNGFRAGETLLGAWSRIYLEIHLNDRISIQGGVFGNQPFASDESDGIVRPVVSLRIRTAHDRFVFGTLPTVERREGIGPDRTTLHGLLPPIQRESLAFSRPCETGLEWISMGPRLTQDAWVSWRRLNTVNHREQFDAGIVGSVHIRTALSLGYQWHVVHHGGQLYDSGPVADSLAGGPGIVASGPWGSFENVSGEAYLLLSHDGPDRRVPRDSVNGAGVFTRLSAEKAMWRGHLIIWRASDFIKGEGDTNYQSVRLDGTRFRSIRDYAEAGITRVYRPVDGLELEGSFRVHLVEQDFDYSYRILAKVNLALFEAR